MNTTNNKCGCISVRAALKQACRIARLAEHQHDYDRINMAKRFIRSYYKDRNGGSVIQIN